MFIKAVFNTCFLLLLFVGAKAQSAVFAQLTGSPMNTSGWILQGAAKVTNVTGTGNSELLLTPSTANQSGSIFFGRPINLSACNKWKVDFDFRIYDGSVGEGFAFCFLDALPTGNAPGASLGIPAGANGLKVSFDTHNDCNNANPMPEVTLRWGQGYDECASLPTATNEINFLAAVRAPAYAHAQIVYDDGKDTVYLNGTRVIDGYQQFAFNGYMGFTASTGAQTDNQSIKNVIINTQMPPSYAGVSPNPVCPGDTVHLGGPNNPAYSYSWSPSQGLSSITVSNPYAIASNTTGSVQPQKYYVQTSLAGGNGCPSIDSVTITVNPDPLADFDVPVVCLPNGNVTINNKTVIYDNTQSKIKYEWTFSDDGSTNYNTNPTHNYTGVGDDTIYLKATSLSGCVSKVKKSFHVYPQAKASIVSAPPSFCADSAVVFNGSAPGQVIQKWHWNFGDNTSDSVQNPSHTYTTAQTYTVTLSAVTNQGCLTDTPKVTITINPVPVAGFTQTGLACENKQLLFTDASQPVVGTLAKWYWYFDDGTTATGPTAGHGFSYGKHTVTHTVQNSMGCNSLPLAQKITINPTPVANFGYPFVCKNADSSFVDSSTIADGTQAQFKYAWNFGDGSTGFGSSPMHAYAAAGTDTVTLVVTSIAGCIDTVKKIISVSDLPLVDFKILADGICGNVPLQLQDNSSVAFAKLSKLVIYWNLQSLADATKIDSPVPGTIYPHNYTTFGSPASQQFTVTVQATSTGGCFTQSSKVATLLATPQLVFQPIPSFCATSSQAVLLNEAKDTSALTGTGTYSGDGVANGYFTPSAAGAGLHTITYTYAANGCRDSVQQTVKVDVQPTVSAGQTIIILGGGQTVLPGSASGGDNLRYLWSPGATLNNDTLLQPIAMPPSDTYYTLTVTNSTGCFDTAGVLVKVVILPVVPNAFSPNGDGVNDTWQIQYLNSYPDCEVEVFNRYGQIIYRSTGYQSPWNGTYNGSAVPVGTYYYIISTTHLPKPLTGPITILR